MLNYVHQLAANFVCLLLGAVLVMYSRFFRVFHWKQLPAPSGNSASESKPKQ